MNNPIRIRYRQRFTGL